MLSDSARKRYGRQLVMPEIGEEGQERLYRARILVAGAGGLGSPASYYLAAAGVGTIGIVDSDRVELSNLQRQILHRSHSLGEAKALSAMRSLSELNPEISVVAIEERLEANNVEDIINEYDMVVDGCDNFKTRYIINDACVLQLKPYVFGSVIRFEGQTSVFHSPYSGCYRCLFRDPPGPGTVPDCKEAGVLGVTPGIIGVIEATEAIKIIANTGEHLYNRLLIYDGQRMSFLEVSFSHNPECPVCGDDPSIHTMKDENYQIEI